MDLRILLCVFLISCISPLSAARCSRYEVDSMVKMPRWRDVLSLDDFDNYVVNRAWAELYFATPNPPPFEALVNYNTMYLKTGEGTYEDQSIGETSGNNSSCVRIEESFVTRNNRKAMFINENPGYYGAFWSSCPASYVIMFRCAAGYSAKNKCPLKDSFIAILVSGTADDVPLTNILEDLCRATGVKFGSESFRWFFTYGEAKLCAAEEIQTLAG